MVNDSLKLSRGDHDNIIKSKVLSFMLTSPLDTIRQNVLAGKKITLGKIVRGMSSSIVASTCISVPCHYSMIAFDALNIDDIREPILSLAFGIVVANVFKVPSIYFHKRFQTGMSFTPKIPSHLWSNVLKISIVEDLIEEGTKNYFSKKNLMKRVESESEGKSSAEVYAQAATLFMLSYPFDILKNRRYYSRKLKATKTDFLLKAFHKNIQNVVFLNLLSV